MPRCEYSYYVTLLPCNQFYKGGENGGRALAGVMPPGDPLIEPPLPVSETVFVFAMLYSFHPTAQTLSKFRVYSVGLY